MSEPVAGGLSYLALDEWSGYGEAARRLVAGLRALGVPVEYRPWSVREAGAPDSAGAVVRADAPVVAHIVADQLPWVRAAIGDRPLIAHTVWETDRLPAHWPALLNDTDLVLVPCEWNREVFAGSGVTVPIAVVPHVACVPAMPDPGTSTDVPDEVAVFYTITRWDERKAPDLTVRAFLEAFGADDPVMLVVKTDLQADTLASRSTTGAPSLTRTTAWEVVRLVREYPDSAPVRLEVGDWSDAQISALHTRGDCFVSLTRGEGWGLGAFDAAAYGNPVVTTGWGASLEFLASSSAWLIDYDLVPVRHPDASSYSPDQRWAEAHLDDAVAALREIAADVETARRRAAPLAPRILNDYDARSVAGQFLDAIAAVSGT